MSTPNQHAYLAERCEILGNLVSADTWDSMTPMEQRDWMLNTAAPMLQSLQDAVWPGKAKWEPTPEHPQQNFHEAFAECLHSNNKALSEIRKITDAMSERDSQTEPA